MTTPQPLFRIWIDPELPPYHEDEPIPYSATVFHQMIDTPRIKTGYIDRTGRVVIPPSFEAAGCFSEGLAPAGVNDRYGYISTDGKWVIKPRLSTYSGFHEGLASAEEALDEAVERAIDQAILKDLKAETDEAYEEAYKLVPHMGYIDTTGQYAIPPKYYLGEDFLDGCAIVCTRDPVRRCGTNFGMIDRRDNVVIPLSYGGIRPFSNGFARVQPGLPAELEQEPPYGPYGFIDRSNHMVIPYGRFENMESFSDGLAVVENKGKAGAIDPTGAICIRAEFESLRGFREGLSAARIDGMWGFIDKNGVYVIPPIYLEVESFSEGCAYVVDEDEQRGFIDHSGKLIMPAQKITPFERKTSFQNGLALISDDYSQGYIDKTGRHVWRGWNVPHS